MPNSKSWLHLECLTCGKMAKLDSNLATVVLEFIAIIPEPLSHKPPNVCHCMFSDSFRVVGCRHCGPTEDA